MVLLLIVTPKRRKESKKKKKGTRQEGKKTDQMYKQGYAFLNIISILKLICDGPPIEYHEIE